MNLSLCCASSCVAASYHSFLERWILDVFRFPVVLSGPCETRDHASTNNSSLAKRARQVLMMEDLVPQRVMFENDCLWGKSYADLRSYLGLSWCPIGRG